MGVSTRDRISVDLRGIRGAVLAHAAAMGLTASELVREVLAREVGSERGPGSSTPPSVPRSQGQVRISLRMTPQQVAMARDSARSAALPLGDYLSALVSQASTARVQAPRADLATALTRSCGALSTLARDIRHLTQLLARSQVRAAQEYRQRLDDVETEVRAHLRLAAEVVADLDGLRQYRRTAEANKE